jgi:hypothetical protein
MAKKFQTLSAGLTVETFDAVMAEARARNVSASELVKLGLKALGLPVPQSTVEWIRRATKPTQPTPFSSSLTYTGLTPRPRWPRAR